MGPIPSRSIRLTMLDGTEREFRPSLLRLANLEERLKCDFAEAFQNRKLRMTCELFYEFQVGDKLPLEDLADNLPIGEAMEMVASWIQRAGKARPTTPEPPATTTVQ